ncbi:MAG: hypothetical protein K5840_00105 [Eubacterium sp.]|nr:hypothetical protein [Eubacterium sp.]
MTVKIDKPKLDPNNPAQSIAALDTWIRNTVDTLNHVLNNLDESNFVSGTLTDATAQLEEQYRELRTLIIKKTEGS